MSDKVDTVEALYHFADKMQSWGVVLKKSGLRHTDDFPITVVAMRTAAAEIKRLRTLVSQLEDELGEYA